MAVINPEFVNKLINESQLVPTNDEDLRREDPWRVSFHRRIGDNTFNLNFGGINKRGQPSRCQMVMYSPTLRISIRGAKRINDNITQAIEHFLQLHAIASS